MNKQETMTHTVLRGSLIYFLILYLIPIFARGQAESINIYDALETALANNPSLGVASNQRAAAEERVWEAKSRYFPQLSVAAGYTYYQEPNIIVPIHRIGVFPPLDDQIYETSLQLKIPFFNGGRTGATALTAKASLRESRAQEDFVKFALLEGVGQVFIQARQLEDNHRLVTARINSLRRRYRELSLLLKEGRVSPADLALANASIETARADSLKIESQKRELTHRLGQLLGAKKPFQPAISELLTHDSTAEHYSFLMPDSHDIAGPLVSKAQAQFTRAKAFKDVANSTFWPEISAFGLYNYRSGSDLDLIGEWAAGITIRFPLFEGGRRIATRNAAQATLQAAEQGVKSTQQEQEARLNIAREQWQSARLRRQHIHRAAESKATSVFAQQEMYKSGRTALSDLLVQETELLQLQIQEKALAYAENLAVLNYYATAATLTSDKVVTIVRSIP